MLAQQQQQVHAADKFAAYLVLYVLVKHYQIKRRQYFPQLIKMSDNVATFPVCERARSAAVCLHGCTLNQKLGYILN